MAGTCSSPGLMVLDPMLVVDLTGAALGPEWVSIECASKEAYGCGEHGKKFVEGLALYVRRLDCANLNSSLYIRLSEEAVRSIQAELGVPLAFQGLQDISLPDVHGFIKVADRGVLVLRVTFRRCHRLPRDYYLVYDANDASLYMIPDIPAHVEPAYTLTPVPARPAGCRGHQLALASCLVWLEPGDAEQGRLCVCTPETRANLVPDSNGPWVIKTHCTPKLHRAFLAHVIFSFGDKVFWADLSQGVLFSDLCQDGSVMDTRFVSLPDGYTIDCSKEPYDEHIEPVKMTRTMGCVGGSIKFVCIKRGDTSRSGKETMVMVWTLDLEHEQWKEDRFFTCSWEKLWMQACFMNGVLENTKPLEPQYPLLMPDGDLCFLLPKTRRRKMYSKVKKTDYICSFDMSSKCCLSFGQVRNHQVIGLVILPCTFFKDCYPAQKRKPSTRKRKLSGINIKKNLPSIDMQMPMCSPAVAQQGRE